jgi:hypothetical protein
MLRVSLVVIALLLSGCTIADDFTGSNDGERNYDHKSVGNTRDSFGYALNAGNKTAVETYDWETGGGRATIGFSGHVTEGSVEITIYDTAGLEVWSGTFAGNDSQGMGSQRGIPGEWEIKLDFDDFTGSMSFGVSADYSAA